MLSPVYHGENSALEVQHLARAYAMLTDDTTRTMMRLKAVFRRLGNHAVFKLCSANVRLFCASSSCNHRDLEGK
jgi:hypothetical protein